MVDDDYLEGDSLALSSIDLPGRDHLWLVRRVTLESGTGRKRLRIGQWFLEQLVGERGLN